MDSKKRLFINRSKISDSYIFRALRDKTDPYFKDDYELLFFQVSGIAERIAFALGVDIEKVRFLLTVSFTGKVDGGQSTLNYVNGLLNSPNAITEIDIVKNNLRKIFGALEDVFSPEELDEMFNAILHNSKTNEGKIIDISHTLQLVSKHMIRTGKWNGVDRMKYISTTADNIEKEFKETGVIKLDEKTYDFAKTIEPINNYDFNALNDVVEQNKNDKQQMIEALGNFSFSKKKIM